MQDTGIFPGKKPSYPEFVLPELVFPELSYRPRAWPPKSHRSDVDIILNIDTICVDCIELGVQGEIQIGSRAGYW